MDGQFLPARRGFLIVRPWIENFVDNLLLVQFNHRLVAYAIVAVALWHAWAKRRRSPGSKAARRATALAGLTLGQMALGIVTLVLVVPLWAGLAHQVFAMAVLAMAVVHARLSRQERFGYGEAVPVANQPFPGDPTRRIREDNHRPRRTGALSVSPGEPTRSRADTPPRGRGA